MIREFEKYFDEDDTIEDSIFEEKVYVCRQEEVPRFMVSDDNGKPRRYETCPTCLRRSPG